jgi:hypothetical protein
VCVVCGLLFSMEAASFLVADKTTSAGGIKSVSELVTGGQVVPSTVNEVWTSRLATGAAKLMLRKLHVDGFGEAGSNSCVDRNLVTEALTVGVAAGERQIGRSTHAMTSAVAAGGDALVAGDTVLSVNGIAVDSATAYWQEAYSVKGPWRLVTLKHPQGLTVTAVPCVRSGDASLVGAKVHIVAQQATGNSNALAAALGTVHLFRPFPQTRRPIIVTGALVDDRVTAVGGIAFKVLAANAANACVFIVPRPRSERERHFTDRFRGHVIEVSTVQQAVEAIRTSTAECQ